MSKSDISDEDYNHAKLVWDRFNCKIFRDYHDIYLKCDVLLLSDVFERFRKTTKENYGLDPCNYMTSPGLSWDAMLKMTKISLDLFSDYDMHTMIEMGIRGGISMAITRYAKANNKYIESYDEKENQSFLLYLDANNLYGHAMSRSLPVGDFEWEIPTIKEIEEYNDELKKGYIIDCDIEYPVELHDKHNQYPLAPENIIIDNSMLSEHQKILADEYKIKQSKITKLTPNLLDKKNYITHISTLKFYKQQGLIIKKINRAIKFTQSDFLKKYIDYNTSMRAKAKNDFEKDFYKLMNNSVFGKTMENVRNHIDVKLVVLKDKEDKKGSNKILKLASKPLYKDHMLINENLIAMHMRKNSTVLNKPVYIGMTVLDFSKEHMYDFYYNYVMKKYGNEDYNNVKLVMTDTDSLLLHITTKNDIYDDMIEDKKYYDLSDYDQSSKMFDNTNKKVIGKFKDETPNEYISEACSIRSKSYSFKIDKKNYISRIKNKIEKIENDNLLDDNKKSIKIGELLSDAQIEKKKLKGIQKIVIKKEIDFNKYKNAVLNGYTLDVQTNSIRSYNHTIYTQSQNKIAIRPYDDKRRWVDDKGIETKAIGYKNYNSVIV